MSYCRLRGIDFKQTPGGLLLAADARRWAAALASLHAEQRGEIELDLATVNELADDEAGSHLVEAGSGGKLPPESVPRGAPLALWFLVHRPELFREVFLRHEIGEVRAWRTARAEPGLTLPGLKDRATLLAGVLAGFFRAGEGGGRFCTTECYRVSDATCFVAQVADRPQFLETFSDGGKPTRSRLRRARPVLLVYYPGDGTVLLKSHLRSAERAGELLAQVGQAVLGSRVTLCHGFDLEPLKRPFHPLPDAEDMELIRVKSVHLRYPGRAGRRQVKLETLSSDGPGAIDELLAAHVADLTQLAVYHAELHVRLRTDAGSKNYLIRLWPDRCNVSQTPLGDRFRACLKRWGLTHA